MTPHLDGLVVEPERYELADAIAASAWTRREFSRIAGAGLVVAILMGREAEAQQPGRGGPRGGGPQEIGGWVHIGKDGAVTAHSGKVEVGQNVRTSLAQAVADELRVPAASVTMVMSDTALVPYDAGTFGSRSTPAMAPQLRKAAAAAREVLLDLAAEKSKVARATLVAKDGKVSGPKGEPSYTYGELTKGEKLVKVIAADVATTKAEKWTVAGTSVPKANGRDIVTGGHKYASDVTRPDMLFGRILRPAKFKSKLNSVDTKGAEAEPGVSVVREGDLVGVVAPTEFAAAEALKLVKAEWDAPSQVKGDDLFKHLKEKVGRGGGGGFGGRGGGGTRGSIEDGLKAAAKTVTATYTVAYIAHVPLEPRAAVAEWADGKLTVWTGTQRPFGVRDDLARALGVAADKIRVIVPDTGSGYGGKHTISTATEAAILAKKVGKPVKLVWTREEEFTWAYFRPAGVIDVTAGAKADGTLTAWDFHNYNSGGSSLASPYAVANHRAEFHSTDSPLAQGSYRALAATANSFARESAMDELAHAVGLDPLEFRLKNLPDKQHERLKAVLEAAAKTFGWGKAKPEEGHGFGLAVSTEKGSFVASVAEVAVDRKAKDPVRVVRVVTAFECGAVVNPDHLKNQVEGSVMMGLGGALFERVAFDDGEILNASLRSYRVPRFRDAPALETVLLDRKDLPSEGAGETPIIAVAPAVANAIFQATGERLRAMPMVPKGWPK
jgi:isoquinoline 1-oxidoreductase